MDARAVTPLESDALSHKYAEHVLKKTCLGLFPLVPAADSKSEAWTVPFSHWKFPVNLDWTV